MNCPACGHPETDRTEAPHQVAIPFAPPETLLAVTDTCPKCGTSGDFAGENDQRVTEALARATRVAVPRMLDRLGTATYVERALGLPFGTTKRWREEVCSPEGVTLLTILATFPWLLEVSESGFDPRVVAGVSAVLNGSRD